ncbi:MAG TPA: glycosyltransferase [Rubrobacteraceae bacterium]|nr:glycosyltransferase [Rubrobacteraceae bacterium]
MATVSVIIPALNEERHIGRLLSDIRRQSRRPEEVFVVDAGSSDNTVAIVEDCPGAILLRGEPPVARGRTLGGMRATGDVLVFLDADVRLAPAFLERFVGEIEQRGLDVACPLYTPRDSTPAIRVIHAFWNAVLKGFERVLPSGAGHCIAVRGSVFRESSGFDPRLKFDDIELIRRLSRGRVFGIVGEKVFVSDRRYREDGTLRTFLAHLLMSSAFALGKFEWTNSIEYDFGNHTGE